MLSLAGLQTHSKIQTCFDDCRLVARAHRQHFEHTARGPQQLLVIVHSHNANQLLGPVTGQDDQLEWQETDMPSVEVKKRCRCGSRINLTERTGGVSFVAMFVQ